MLSSKVIYDPHVHAAPSSNDLDQCVQDALDFVAATGVEGINVLVIKNYKLGMCHDALYLYLKLLYPDKFSVYNGLATGLKGIPCDAEGMVDQIKEMRSVGFDGVKMWINGSTKDTWGFELDDEILDPVWSYLEQTQYPLLIHVGNTEHWPGKAEDEAKRRALTNEPTNDPLYGRMERVLTKHPNINIVLPHMYFMCEQKERLAAVMEQHPNVKLDICPGSAMFYYMSQDLDFWRNFFIKYQDRILFGTDNHIERPGGLEQVQQVRWFLESNETRPAKFFSRNDWGFEVTGIGPLSDEILHKIYKANFEKVRGSVPTVVVEKAIAYLEKELHQMEQLDEKAVSEVSKEITRQVIARLKETK